MSNIMKIIYNNILPPPWFKAINLFGFLFVRKGKELKEKDVTHETIHTKQMQEMLYIPFYIWYVVEWLVKLVKYMDSHTAYRTISFEREAYGNQDDKDYPEIRKHYSWIKYLKQ